jgi:hypothetical protein
LGAIQGPTPENVIGTIVIRVSLSPRALRNVITTAHWQYGGGWQHNKFSNHRRRAARWHYAKRSLQNKFWRCIEGWRYIEPGQDIQHDYDLRGGLKLGDDGIRLWNIPRQVGLASELYPHL